MLVRTFRLTDKLTNAFLRLFGWFAEALLAQAYKLRLALFSSLEALWLTLLQLAQSGRVVYQNNEERRRAIMARRSAEALTRPAVHEDPLRTQNRALSMFTVVLMASLLLLVLWFTSSGQFISGPSRPGGSSGQLPLLQTRAAPTAFPTIIPTSTQVPDPLRIGGSIVYAMRDRGHDNLWALGIGQNTPVRLTNTPSNDRDPVWSPDGTRIAFASHRDGNWDLYIMTLATGNLSRLTYDLDYEAAPTWSPDSKYIAYESYQNSNLDIYITASDGSGKPIPLTHNLAPDFSPAWAPDGRHIAYVSLRDGNQEIYVIDLNSPVEDKAVRFTTTPDVDEDFPAWSPDGQQLSYSARVNGLDLVYAKPVAHPEADPVVIGQGRQPAWAPNGSSLIFAVDNGAATTLVGGQVGNFGVSALAYSLKGLADHPSWTSALLPTSLQQGAGTGDTEPPLYKEEIHYQSQTAPYNKLAILNGINAPKPYLSDKVDDSFLALRAEVVKQAGTDFLGTLKDALWEQDRVPDPGQSRQSWHYAGRAFDFDKNLVFGSPSPVEVVREDVGVNTYWRVYLRVPEELQGGQLGEPLKHVPWDFASRSSGDPQAFEDGGRPKTSVPSGYYVDFTELAANFGWLRIPSERDWRRNYSSLLYWEFDKRETLSWNEAMLQLYSQQEVAAFLNGPTLVPTPVAPPTETPQRGGTRTPTPIPPDVSGSGNH